MLVFFWLVAASLLLFAYCLSTLFRQASLQCNAMHAAPRYPILPLACLHQPTCSCCECCSKTRVAGGVAAVLYSLAMMPGCVSHIAH